MTQTGTKSINTQSISIKAVLNVSKNDLNGRKSMHLPILFPQPFNSTPVVSVGLTGLRTRQESISFDAEVENVTPTGFDLVLAVASENAYIMLTFQWLATDA